MARIALNLIDIGKVIIKVSIIRQLLPPLYLPQILRQLYQLISDAYPMYPHILIK